MKRTLTTILSLVITTTFAQPTWQKGGNNNLPVGSQPSIGTSAAWNSPLQVITNGTQRLYLDNTNGGILGNVGIGSMFSTAFRPVSNLHIQQDNNHFQFAALRDWR